LRLARSVQSESDPHAEPALSALARTRPAPRLFGEADRLCPSFSSWWAQATRGLTSLRDLPGLAPPA
jgi:hypothetical protein